MHDTHAIPLNGFQKVYVVGMTSLSQPKKTGRPSKGKRHVMTTRLAEDEAQKIFKIAKSQGVHASDIIAEQMYKYLATIDLDELDLQEELPIRKAS